MTGATAGEMLVAVVADLGEQVRDRRPAALADEPDAVHQLRTATRRLRNVLRAFETCFDADAVAELRDCLKSYGDLLGACRDLEVRADHCARAIAEVELEPGLQEPLVLPLLAAHRAAHATLVAWHRGPELAALDTLLDLWSTAPPLTARATKDAEKVATKAVGKQVDRVLRAGHELDDPERADQAHDLRKAARRLRHTADAVSGPPAAVLAGWAPTVGALGHAIQAMLGEHRDALLLAEHVRRHAEASTDAASYLALVAHAEREARMAIGGLARAVLELRERRRP